MKRTTLILLALLIGGCLLKAQNHSGFKFSTTFNNTHLSPDGDQEYASYSEGSGWEFGYSFHIPVWQRLSLQIEPALGQLPFDYNNAESEIYWDKSDRSTTTLSANILANVHILKGWSVQAGPRFDYRILGDRNKDFNMELSAGLLKHFKWLDVYARYHHGILNVYGIETYFYGYSSSDPADTTLPVPQASFQETEGYTRCFEIGIVLPVFKLFGNK